MTRTFLAVCVALGAATAARAADPQPLWEVDAITAETRVIAVQWLGFSSDGKLLIARAQFRTAKETHNQLVAWDIQTRTEKIRVDVETGEHWEYGLCGNAATAGGTVLIPGDKSREVRLSDGKVRELGPGNQRAVWVHPETRQSVWFAESDGGLGITTGKVPPFDPDAKQSRLEDQSVTQLRPEKEGEITAVAVNSGLTRLALTGWGGERWLRLYAIEHNKKPGLTEVATVPAAHEAAIRVMRFSPDGKTLAAGGSDCSVSLWDVAKAGKQWKPRATVAAGRFTPVCLSFSPDGRTLAVGTTERQGPNLFMIDVVGGKLVSPRNLGEAVGAVAYSPDGKLLVTGHDKGKVRVWDAAAMRGD